MNPSQPRTDIGRFDHMARTQTAVAPTKQSQARHTFTPDQELMIYNGVTHRYKKFLQRSHYKPDIELDDLFSRVWIRMSESKVDRTEYDDEHLLYSASQVARSELSFYLRKQKQAPQSLRFDGYEEPADDGSSSVWGSRIDVSGDHQQYEELASTISPYTNSVQAAHAVAGWFMVAQEMGINPTINFKPLKANTTAQAIFKRAGGLAAVTRQFGDQPDDVSQKAENTFVSYFADRESAQVAAKMIALENQEKSRVWFTIRKLSMISPQEQTELVGLLQQADQSTT
jgi:hypothetical protein